MTVFARMANADGRAPMHLSRSARDFYRSVSRTYVLEEHHLRILESALSAWDRMNQAREIVEKEGIVAFDRAGRPIVHPAVIIERDSRAAFARLIRQLDLDVEPPKSIGRPGGAA